MISSKTYITTHTAGVVGKGAVGNAICKAFGAGSWDLEASKRTAHSLRHLCYDHHIIFICVPTPSLVNGACDTSIVEEVVNEIKGFNLNNTIVVKSTVTPGTCDRLGVISNPEFLTQARAYEDFTQQDIILLGGDIDGLVADLYSQYFPSAQIFNLHPTQTELIKYACNCLAAIKVAFSNELYQACQALGIDYEQVSCYLATDKRFGYSHYKVPGPDGKLGFGGSCLPKDTQAFIFFMQQLGVDEAVVKAALKKSVQLREVD